MIENILYILLAALGLSFLVLIHELGHYIVAKWVGMRVEVFSIGFGKPILSWKRKNNEVWQICYLLFGGYVRIAGMEKTSQLEPHEVKDGFFGKSPWARIAVALAGPIVNLAFAFLAFSIIFSFGGREKPFSEYTKIIGFIDPNAEVYEKGLRPGDTISSIDGRTFKGFQDLLYSSVLNQASSNITGKDIDYYSGSVKPYDIQAKSYPHPLAKNGLKTFGVLAPATYLVYEKFPGNVANPIPEGSPMYDSGIRYGDRILWADGQLIFSVAELSSIVNSPTSLLTVKRGNEVILAKVPRVKIRDMRTSQDMLSELDDWQHEIGLKGDVKQLTFIPYDISSYLVVQKSISYVDENSQIVSPLQTSTDSLNLLKNGDRILAVDGVEVVSAFQFLGKVQEKRVQLIVQNQKQLPDMSWKNQDEVFEHSANWQAVYELSKSVGLEDGPKNVGNVRLLKSVAPIAYKDFPRKASKQASLDEQIFAQQAIIDKMKDPIQKKDAQNRLDQFKNRLFLGIAFQDYQVNYNPPPWTTFSQVCQDTGKTLGALVTGKLNPKWMSGPVGIVHVMHHGWSLGFKEALYWLGLISLNLGLLNLLPVPVLDGGHIVFSLWEVITRKPIKAKVMERMIIPFVILLIAFFVFVTYQDIVRLVTRFF